MSELNITGLPPLINTLESGRIYCVTVQSSRWFDTLMSHVVGKRNTLLSFRNMTEDYPNVLEKFDAQQIDILSIDKKNILKLSKKIDRFMIELSHLEIKDGALYIDVSDLLLSNKKNNEHLVIELKQFARKQNLTIVLLFSEGERDSAVEQFLIDHRTEFFGLMKFEGEIEPNTLQIDIWYTETGCVVNKNYRVQNLNGKIALLSSDNLDLATAQFEQSNVVVDEHYVELGSKLNRSWTLAKNDDDLFRLVKENPSTTVLIHALNTTSLKDLAKRIYKLRQLAGQNLKVIVLEVSIHLRMTEQSILRCLGANLILPSKIHINTLINVISSTSNLVFIGDLTANFYDIFDDGAMPSKLGYLSPERFAEELTSLTLSSTKYGISSALALLKIPSGIAPMDTIKYAQFNRHGDVFTILDTYIYVYLYGCREEDINSTLTYILGAEPLLIFISSKQYVKPDAIQLQIMNYKDHISKNPTVDFQNRIDELAGHREKMETMRADKIDNFEINVAIPSQLKLK
jgi:cellulose biosynthesis protein BcsE